MIYFEKFTLQYQFKSALLRTVSIIQSMDSQVDEVFHQGYKLAKIPFGVLVRRSYINDGCPTIPSFYSTRRKNPK